MKVVVLNAGSGSQKCSLFEVPGSSLSGEALDPIWEAKLDSTAPDQPKGKLVIHVCRQGEDIEASSNRRECVDDGTNRAPIAYDLGGAGQDSEPGQRG
jgi:acetate kinase